LRCHPFAVSSLPPLRALFPGNGTSRSFHGRIPARGSQTFVVVVALQGIAHNARL
jgi:hypothetical protein